MRIIHSCTITGNRILVDQDPVFSQPPEMPFTDFAKAAFKHLDIDYPKFYKMDKLCKLGFLAAEYLLSGCPDCCPDTSTAIVFGNSSGSMDSDMAHLANIKDDGTGQASPSVFVYTLANIVIGEIAIRNGIKGETAFFICEHDDDPLIEQYAASLLDSHRASSCLSGWIDYLEGQYLARLCWMER